MNSPNSNHVRLVRGCLLASHRKLIKPLNAALNPSSSDFKILGPWRTQKQPTFCNGSRVPNHLNKQTRVGGQDREHFPIDSLSNNSRSFNRLGIRKKWLRNS